MPSSRRQQESSLTSGSRHAEVVPPAGSAHKGSGQSQRMNGQQHQHHQSAKAGTRVKTPSPTHPIDVNHSNSNNQQQQHRTQVLYYLEEVEKPFDCSIQKKLGEITLKDFKTLIEESCLYHFFFKAPDPEYGTVKEELCNDDDILPGWEGKIVAWVVEEEGTVC